MSPATINKPNILGVAMDKLFDLRAQILAAAGAYDLIQQINEAESTTDQLHGNFPDGGDPQQSPDLDAHKQKSIRSMG